MRRLLFALPVVITAACTYDWTVGPADSGGSSGVVAEAGTGADTAADTAAPRDAAADSSAQCDALFGQVGLAHAQILSCTTTCADSVTDECGCTLPVANAQSSEAKGYSSAVAAYRSAGCVADCSQPCNVVRHLCFQSSVCT
jgi:hypothetical protein